MLVLTACPWDDKKEPDVLSVSQTELTFGADETQARSVTITTNADFWEYAVSSDWISVQESENTLFVAVSKYTDTSIPRTGSVTVRAGDAPPVRITVTQYPRDVLGVSPSEQIYEADETGDKTFSIITNAATWDAVFVESPSWVKLTKNNNSLTVSVTSKNTLTSPRSATVRVTAGSADPVTVTVTQKGAPIPGLQVSTSSLSASYTAQTLTFGITSNISWTVSRGSYTWITVSPTSGSNNATVTVSLSANTGSARTGTITVSGSGITRTITINQSGPQPSPSQAQVRFRKTSNNKSTYEMAVVTASLESLAYYQFATSTGTTNYTSIPTGNHYVLVNEGGTVYRIVWNSGSETYNFQASRRYTFEYDGSGYSMIKEGTYNTAPQEAIKIPVTLKRMENMTEIPKPLE